MTNPTLINFLQINLGRARRAHDMLDVFSQETNSDVLILSEPNINISRNKGYILDKNEWAAIVLLNKNIPVCNIIQGCCFVGLELEDLLLFSVYISPNWSEEVAEDIINQISETVRNVNKHLIIAGDFNAKATEWSSKITNTRGFLLLDWIGAEDLCLLNQGTAPTFVRDQQESHIDITFCSRDILSKVMDWKVRENEESYSYHRYITYKYIAKDREVQEQRPVHIGWKFTEEKATVLQKKVEELCYKKKPKNAEELIRTITKACNLVLSKKKSGCRNKKPVFWWSPRISELRQECIKCRRKMTRWATRFRRLDSHYNHLRSLYKEAKIRLKDEIVKSKDESWREVCEEIETDIWGLGYKIAAKKLCKTPLKLTSELEQKVLNTLFPQMDVPVWEIENVNREDIPIISIGELMKAAINIKMKKAPGPDLISPEILKCVVFGIPNVVLEIFNDILVSGVYPVSWKKGKITLIPKPGKQPFQPSSYRPLCLLDTFGKLFEALLSRRIFEFLGEDGLDKHQFGFRPGRSTVHSIQKIFSIVHEERRKSFKARKLCLLVTLDVKNAFSSASWSEIVKAMRNKNIPSYIISIIQSYFSERKLISPNGIERDMTAGACQGSNIGPLLWNILYDSVLKIKVSAGVTLVAYADDLAVMVVAKHPLQVEEKANATMNKISQWMCNHSLKLAPEKSEAVLLIGRKKCGPIRILLDGETIELKNNVRYLGVELDRKLSFTKHVELIRTKANARTTALMRIMPRHGGPGWWKRKILHSIFESTVLYAAPVWCSVLRKEKYKRQMLSVQRKFALNVARAYRTVSTEAVMVLAGVIPIDLSTQERSRTFGADNEAKAMEREVTLNEWQQRWNRAATGEWTRQLIPDILPWLKRRHGELTFHLTQFLSGHGCFASFLHRIGKAETPKCWYCEEVDTPAHTFYDCHRWTQQRTEAQHQIGEEFNIQNLISLMLKNKENWASISRLVKNIVSEKEKEEKRRKSNSVGITVNNE